MYIHVCNYLCKVSHIQESELTEKCIQEVPVLRVYWGLDFIAICFGKNMLKTYSKCINVCGLTVV